MSVDIQSVIIGILTCFVVPVVISTVVTVLICQYRTDDRKHVSVGTVLVGTVSVPVLYAVLGTFFGSDEAWTFILSGLLTIICFLPAGAVVLYYRKRSKRNEKPVA
jgi:hypothetical protein